MQIPYIKATQALQLLKDLKNTPVTLRKDRGLCSSLRVLRIPTRYINELMQSWCHHSGDIDYPVGDNDFFPEDAFLYKHRWKGVYGERRESLLDHLIVTLEELCTMNALESEELIL